MSEQTIDKLQELYKTGRYECDVWFYEKLIELIHAMEMHEYISVLEDNYTRVKRIHKLIEENSDSLNEDFDEDQAALKAEEIKKQIHHLTPNHVSSAMSHLQKQRFTSYTQHAANLIQKYNYHPKYQEIFQTIVNSVYDPVIRVQNVLVCTLFMLRNGERIQEILTIYERGIEGGLAVMKAFRARATLVKAMVRSAGDRLKDAKNGQGQDLNEEEAINIKKTQAILAHVQNYCHGIYFIYSTTAKLCDLVKILQGKKNFILKLNSYKPDVEQVIDLWDHFGCLSSENCLPRTKAQLKAIEKEMDHLPTKELQQLFIGDKSGIDKINRTCKICLRYVQKDQSNGTNTAEYHRICQVAMKELLKEAQAGQKL